MRFPVVEEGMAGRAYAEIMHKLAQLASDVGIVDLDGYLHPLRVLIDCSDVSVRRTFLMERFACSLQNSGRMTNSIRFWVPEVLPDGSKRDAGAGEKAGSNWEKILAALGGSWGVFLEREREPKDVYGMFVGGGLVPKATLDRVAKGSQWQNTSWGKYATGLCDAADYVRSGDKVGRLVRATSLAGDDWDDGGFKAALKSLTADLGPVKGLGFALSCDFLKESGCSWLAKPDVHMTLVMSKLCTRHLEPWEVLRCAFEAAAMARRHGVDPNATAYKLDKAVWLLSTGNFYRDGLHGHRDLLVRRLERVGASACSH